jgi:hypothetical protein
MLDVNSLLGLSFPSRLCTDDETVLSKNRIACLSKDTDLA